MLVSFSISNFLSFRNKQTLSLEAGKFRNNSDRLEKQGKYKLLKFLSIYGANASGKSNLITALGFFQIIIIDSFKTGSYPLYCRIKDEFKNEPSLFEIKIVLNNRVFIYGFNALLSKSTFTDEWLYEELQNGSHKSIFTRNITSGEFNLGEYFTSSSQIERLNIYGEDVKSDGSVLFLKLMNQNKSSLYSKNSKLDIFKEIYQFIKYKLDVNSPESPITNYFVLNDAEGINKITTKLSEFATDIIKVDIIPISQEKVASSLSNEMIQEIQKKLLDQKNKHPDFDEKNKPTVLIREVNGRNMFIIELSSDDKFEFKTMTFKHKNSDAVFTLKEESDGTIRLLDIIEVLLTTEENKVYCIDEINRKFHPLLTRKFVNDFLILAKERNIQLIVTTHESQLMDFKLLRRDEINFINKNDDGYSTIYSLDDYDVRFDKKIVNEYLKGSYGAIPKLNNNLPINEI